jgi:4-amino-4-deoxy-L-arabinose transferase-like glycosyltransferase
MGLRQDRIGRLLNPSVLALSLLVSLFLVGASARFPPLGDQVWDLAAAEGFLEGTATRYLRDQVSLHPPFYSLLISWVSRVAGFSVVQSARAIGAVCFVAALLLVYRITLDLSREPYKSWAPSLAAFIYAVHPAAVQGAQVLKMDTSIFTLSVLVFCLGFLRWLKGRRPAGLIQLGVFFGLVLMSKVMTGLAVPLALGLYILLEKGWSRALGYTGAVFLIGFLLYGVAWFLLRFLYPQLFLELPFFTHFISPFVEYKGSLVGHGLTARLSEWFTASFVLLWFSPALVVLWLFGAADRLRTFRSHGRPEGEDFLIILTLIIMGAYFVTGGLAHGFPRYQYPALSLFIVVVALYLGKALSELKGKERLLSFTILCTIAVLVLDRLLVGDLLYTVYFKMRESLALGETSPAQVAVRFAKQMGFFLALALACFGFVRFLLRAKSVSALFGLALLLLFFGSSLAQDIRHLRAPYHTGYTYGASGSREVLNMLEINYKGGKKILAPDSLALGFKKGPLYKRQGNELWNNPKRFLKRIRVEDPDVIAYGLATNTVGQYRRTFNNESVRRLLTKRYRKRRIGSFTIWEKKG